MQLGESAENLKRIRRPGSVEVQAATEVGDVRGLQAATADAEHPGLNQREGALLQLRWQGSGASHTPMVSDPSRVRWRYPQPGLDLHRPTYGPTGFPRGIRGAYRHKHPGEWIRLRKAVSVLGLRTRSGTGTPWRVGACVCQ